MPEWDDLLANARVERDARTEELRRLEAVAAATADDLAVRRAKAEGDYVRIVEVFQRELHPSDYPLVQLTRTKKPLVGSRFKKARVLFIAGAGSEWWEVNKGYGPRSNYSRTLVVGPGIKPGIWGGDSLSYEQYRLLASTPEAIHGLKTMLLITRASENFSRHFLTFCCEHLRIGRPSTARTSNFAWMSRRRARRPCVGTGSHNRY
jgi:hypothetical protein